MAVDFATFKRERKPSEAGGFAAFKAGRGQKPAQIDPSVIKPPEPSFAVGGGGNTAPVLTQAMQEERAGNIGQGMDATGRFAKVVGQGIARAWAATGARIAQTSTLSDTDMVDPKTVFGMSPDGIKIAEAVFGKSEPFNATSEDVEFLETFGTDPEIAAGTGGSLTLLLSALDVTGAGGAAKGLAGAIRAIKAAKTAEEALEVARAIGLADDVAKQYADVFATANTTADAKKALEAAVKLQNTTKRTGPAEAFTGFPDLSTKLLEKLKGRTTVSKQFISDLTNSPDLKQPERDLIRKTLEEEGDQVNVGSFANRVKTELLPLKRIGREEGEEFMGQSGGYESTTLSEELRGPVYQYSEHVYESPIKTSAGSIHPGLPQSDSYFAHSRVEDIADKFTKDMQPDKPTKTRRVIEIQSDLFQKGNLENDANKLVNRMTDAERKEYDKLENFRQNSEGTLEQRDAAWKRQEELRDEAAKRTGTPNEKLSAYRNTWHERVIREEVKQAAKDGKTKLQFPTGETAMKIEGLGENTPFYSSRMIGEQIFAGAKLNDSHLVVGNEIFYGGNTNSGRWIITDVLGDGKFKAVPKSFTDKYKAEWSMFGDWAMPVNQKSAFKRDLESAKETFDISGKVDTNNPIYRFYEKEVGRYLKNKYGAEIVTDAQGVKWMEVKINPRMADQPVEAFGAAAGVQTDEDGNITFDPLTAVMGVAGFAAAKKGKDFIKKGRKADETTYLYDDVESMERSARAWEAPVDDVADKRAKEVLKTTGKKEKIPQKIEDVLSEDELRKLEELKMERDMIRDTLTDEGRQLLDLYKGRRGVPGLDPDDLSLGELTARAGKADQPKFRRYQGLDDKIDDIMGNPGGSRAGKDIEERSQALLDTYRAQSGKAKGLTQEIREITKEAREKLKQAQSSVRARVKNFTNRKDILEEVKRWVRREGDARREKVANIQDFFKLDDADMKQLTKGERDLTLMSEGEFDAFLGRMEEKATEMYLRMPLLNELKYTIFEKEFVNLDNLREAMDLPPIDDMTDEQMRAFNDLLKRYEKGDVFLGKREIETIDNTDIAGIRTFREARQNILREVNEQRVKKGLEPTTITAIEETSANPLHYVMGDVNLARQGPVQELMVRTFHKGELEASARALEVEARVDELFKAARASRPRSILQRLIPTDDYIWNWMEADDLTKMKMAQSMTKEELEAAVYMRAWYADARDYLQEREMLKRYISDYITHTQRGFLEAWYQGSKQAAINEATGVRKDVGALKKTWEGLKAAFRETAEAHKQEEAYFKILQGKEGNVLPLEKFFQFSMQRTGNLVPTRNASKAFMKYVETFEKKRYLDEVMPKLEVYIRSVSPMETTEQGLEFNDTLMTFFKRWMNTKKGRPVDLSGALPGGSQLDWALRSGVAMTRIIDLGWNIATGGVASLGAQSAAYLGLGEKAYATGLARLGTKQGRAISKKYENFVGRPVTKRMTATKSTLGDNIVASSLGLFSIADRKARQVYLLGSMTPQEFRAGEVSIDRLTDIKLDLGQHLPIENGESVIGKTAAGKFVMQYKTWAPMLLTTTLHDINQVQKLIRKDGLKGAKSKEGARILRRIFLGTVVGATVHGVMTDSTPNKDKTFLENVATKAARDSLSIISALDPSMYMTLPRLVTFLDSLRDSVWLTVNATRDKNGELSGPKKLGRTVTPTAIKQFIPPEKKKSSGGAIKVKVPTVKVPTVKIPSVGI